MIYWKYDNLPDINKPLLKKTKYNPDFERIEHIYYLNMINSFDIETTTIKDPERPYSFMFSWQCCLDNDRVYMGRTFKDFRKFISKLKKKYKLSYRKRIIIYVHNLSYEFVFLKEFLTIYDIFMMGSHKVLYFVAEGIEFRCSYLLSNMNLEKFCDNSPNCIHKKLSGKDFDYSKIRTPETPLSASELQYMYNDVKGLCECIADRLIDDDLITIPKTSTGYVRREMRKNMRKNSNNRQLFTHTRLTPFLYRLNRLAFRGGDTHSNPKYTNRIVYDVNVKDIKSSYPAVLEECTFPIGPFIKSDINEFFNDYKNNKKVYCALINIIYVDIEYIAPDNMPYIPASKCFELAKPVYDNGRIRSADSLQIAITDIDYDIIEASYKYKKKIIIGVWTSERGSLPDEFKNTVMEFFEIKSKLDGDPEHKYEYMKAKNNLNSTYGMCVTKLDRPIFDWVEGEPVITEMPLDKTLEKYYNSKNNFLPYQWGVWCTAWARLRLRTALQMVGKDCIYCDTDSIFYIGDHEDDFNKLNEILKDLAIKHRAFARNSKGELLYLGIFEDDKFFKEFKTLGAKKYIGRLSDGSMYCTIAGVNKNVGAAYFDKVGFDRFRDGEIIENSGHLTAFYNDDKPHEITINGCSFWSGSNIALIDNTYQIGITDDYKRLILDQYRSIIHYMD